MPAWVNRLSRPPTASPRQEAFCTPYCNATHSPQSRSLPPPVKTKVPHLLSSMQFSFPYDSSSPGIDPFKGIIHPSGAKTSRGTPSQRQQQLPAASPRAFPESPQSARTPTAAQTHRNPFSLQQAAHSHSMPPKSPQYSAASPHTPRRRSSIDIPARAAALRDVASPHTPQRTDAYSRMISHSHESGTATAPGSVTAHSSSSRGQNEANPGMR